jgi:hypothetical protein
MPRRSRFLMVSPESERWRHSSLRASCLCAGRGQGVLKVWRWRRVVRVVEPPAESPEEAPLEDEGEPAEDGVSPP